MLWRLVLRPSPNAESYHSFRECWDWSWPSPSRCLVWVFGFKLVIFLLNSLFEAGRSHWVRLHLSMSIIAVLQSKSAWWKLGRAKRILSRSDSMPDERQVDFKGSNLWRCHHFCSKRRPLAVRWIHIGISMPGHSVKHCLMSVGGNLMNPSACL